MNSHTPLILTLSVLLIVAAGCTMNTGSSAVPAAPAAMTPSATLQQPSAATTPGSGIDTMINVHFKDYACLDLQKELGVEYLYPDQKYTVWVTSPGSNTINVNVLLVDNNDNLKLRETEPAWDNLKKVWVYEGIVPLVQFNDVIVPQEKTFTIKNQGKYFLCVDDRKETGSQDIFYRVPVKVTRA